MISLEKLNEWNEEQYREDTLYRIEYSTFKKGYRSRNYLERDAEGTYGEANTLEEALEIYSKCIERCQRVYNYYNVELKEAFEDKYGNVEYDTIKEEGNVRTLMNRETWDAEILEDCENYEEKLEFIQENKQLFSMKAICEKAGVNYQVYKNANGKLSKSMVNKLFEVFEELQEAIDDIED